MPACPTIVHGYLVWSLVASYQTTGRLITVLRRTPATGVSAFPRAPAVMSRDLLIDGYNLLHAAGLAPRTDRPGDLERARRALLRLIAGQMSADQRRRTTFVFDAKAPPPGAGHDDTHAEMRVRYALEQTEADDLIETIIAEHSAPRRLVVVSGDHRLHKAARRRKASAIDSDAFLDECARRVYCRQTPRTEHETKPGAETSPAALAEWLSIFDVDPHDLAAEVDRPPRSTPAPPALPPTPPAATRPPESKSPRSRSPSTARPKHPAPPPTSPSAIDDLAFWEARIADLFRRRPDEFADDR